MAAEVASEVRGGADLVEWLLIWTVVTGRQGDPPVAKISIDFESKFLFWPLVDCFFRQSTVGGV
jgi:hypothetical protein